MVFKRGSQDICGTEENQFLVCRYRRLSSYRTTLVQYSLDTLHDSEHRDRGVVHPHER